MYRAYITFKTDNGQSDVEMKEFVTERGARLYAIEESKWENTLSACVYQGAELIFEAEGEFCS